MNPNNLNSKEVLETQISEIQATSTPKSSVVVEEPKSSKGWKIATICAAILAVAGISFGVFEMLNSNKNSNANIESQLASSGLAIEDGKVVVTDKDLAGTLMATDDLDEEVRNFITSLRDEIRDSVTGTLLKVYNDDHGIFIAQDGIKTAVMTDRSYGLLLDLHGDYDDEKIEAFQNVLKERFFKYNFTQQDGFAPNEGYYVDDKVQIVCSMDGNSVYCTHTSWASLDDETTTLINDLADAYYATNNRYLPIFKFSQNGYAVNIALDDVKESKVSPFQRITAQCGSGYCLFYRADSNAKWQFFKGGQDALSCSDYDTEDVRKAFAGDKCYKEGVTIIGEDSYDTVQP